MDYEFDIATARSRKVSTWKNTKVKWSQFVARLKEPTVTHETMAEYDTMGKEEKDQLKDVGGFVGGYLIDGKRSNVKYRQLVTLDADFGGQELYEEMIKVYGPITSCIYSTHKHRANRPRVRIIVLLDRKVTPSEYQAIARKLAWHMGIDKFDDTTYQPQRLMYWPSRSKDAPYLFKDYNTEPLKADKVLSEYEKWDDVSSWPTSNRVADTAKNMAGKKAQNPLEKEGVVGAFCRAYSIHEAIEAFVEDYVPCDIEGRYTYAKGSTTGGVVTYNDLFSYSHHDTDPASMVLCNAFDLVRLHLYGDLDVGSEDKKATNKPSYKAMVALVNTDKKAREQLALDTMANVMSEFTDVDETPEQKQERENWQKTMQINKSTKLPESNAHNVELIFKNDNNFKGVFAYDEFNRYRCIKLDESWRPSDHYRPLRDVDHSRIRNYLSKVYHIVGQKVIEDSLNVVCYETRIDPLKEYLLGLEWDGVERVDTLFTDYLAVEDSELIRAVARKTLCGAVARGLEPGCKFDTMLIISGEQGIGKSTLFAKLGGPWFSDSVLGFKGKDSMEQIQGRWIIEVGELSTFKKADSNELKNYLSKKEDSFRKAYGVETESYPRRCIFVGTTNEGTYLRDLSGNRRYWPIYQEKGERPIKNAWDLTQSEVDQIWAEAVMMYSMGESLILEGDLEEQMYEAREQALDEDPRVSLIEEYLDRMVPEGFEEMDQMERHDIISRNITGPEGINFVCARQVWGDIYGKNGITMTRFDAGEINAVLSNLKGWKPCGLHYFGPYGRQRGYERIVKK